MQLTNVAIGQDGPTISNLGLGGTCLGNLYQPIDDARAVDLVRHAHSADIRLFDVAPNYGLGLSERRLGMSLSEIPRASVTIATKVGYELVPLVPGEEHPTIWAAAPPMKTRFDFTYDGAMRSFESSLKRLSVDRIDMLAIHDPDEAGGATPLLSHAPSSHFRETMEGAYRALVELRDQKVIGAIGIGINQWQMLIDFAREGDFDYFLLAGRYTLLEQEPLDYLLPLCLEKNIRLIVGGPFNSGILATGAVPGSYYNYAPAAPDILNTVRRMEGVSARHSVSLMAAALQFPFGHPAVASVIPGGRSSGEIDQHIEAFQQPIPDDFWAELKTEGLIAAQAPVPARSNASV